MLIMPQSDDPMHADNTYNPYVYTPSTDSWQVKNVSGFEFLWNQRESAAMVSVGTKTYLHGGYSGVQTTAYNYEVNVLFGET